MLKMSFGGFSQDDILSLSNKESTGQAKSVERSVKAFTAKKSTSLNSTSIKKKSPVKIISIEEALPNTDLANKNQTINTYAQITSTNSPIKLEQEDENIAITNSTHVETKRNFDLFAAKQKVVEEQNRKRKELLARALADRTKRTQEETERLNEIHTEFGKLDAVLSNDVNILRKQIELASGVYDESYKRYKKIEKEFLAIKLDLQHKLEKKELLTEHLCAIIEKNEERKAEKLTQLMEKLQVTDFDLPI